MKSGEADILFVPGAQPLDEGHWQTRWRNRLSTGRFACQPDHCADLGAFRASLREALAGAQRPVVLVGHSFGVLGLAHAAPSLLADLPAGLVRGAFLVSAPGAEAVARTAGVDDAFAPAPSAPLPFPSLLVASRDDPHARFEEMESMALDWGAQIVDAGASGHIDAESGHGPWPEGLMRFAAFLSKL
jgi:predicted alpha/beta hydrolase family esterase